MVQCVRHFVLPRLKKDAGLPFFFPLITHSEPLNWLTRSIKNTSFP